MADPDVVTRIVQARGRNELLVSTVLLAFGLLLGLVDLISTFAPLHLRVPALVAALLLVAEGWDSHPTISTWSRGGSRSAEPAAGPAPEVPATNRASGRPVIPVSVGRPADASKALRARTTSTVAAVILVLAVWLALASLVSALVAPALAAMSMVSAFVLFAHAWTLLPLSGNRRPTG
jgi:hypothetical protein